MKKRLKILFCLFFSAFTVLTSVLPAFAEVEKPSFDYEGKNGVGSNYHQYIGPSFGSNPYPSTNPSSEDTTEYVPKEGELIKGDDYTIEQKPDNNEYKDFDYEEAPELSPPATEPDTNPDEEPTTEREKIKWEFEQDTSNYRPMPPQKEYYIDPFGNIATKEVASISVYPPLGDKVDEYNKQNGFNDNSYYPKLKSSASAQSDEPTAQSDGIVSPVLPVSPDDTVLPVEEQLPPEATAFLYGACFRSSNWRTCNNNHGYIDVSVRLASYPTDAKFFNENDQSWYNGVFSFYLSKDDIRSYYCKYSAGKWGTGTVTFYSYYLDEYERDPEFPNSKTIHSTGYVKVTFDFATGLFTHETQPLYFEEINLPLYVGEGAVDWLKDKLETIKVWVLNLYNKLYWLTEKVWYISGEIAEDVKWKILSAWGSIIDTLDRYVFTPFSKQFKEMIDWLKDTPGKLSSFSTSVQTKFNELKTWFDNRSENEKENSNTFWGNLKTKLENLGNSFTSATNTMKNDLGGKLNSVGSTISSWSSSLNSNIKAWFEALPGKFSNFFSTLGVYIANSFTKGVDRIRDFFNSVGDWMYNVAIDTRTFFVDMFNRLYNNFSNFFGWLGGKFSDGFNLVLNGIKGFFIPDDDFFKNFSNQVKSDLDYHYGVLFNAFTFFGDFAERLQNCINVYSNQASLSIPKVTLKVKDIDVTLFEAQTVNLNSITNSVGLSKLYTAYSALVAVIFALLFAVQCKKMYFGVMGVLDY